MKQITSRPLRMNNTCFLFCWLHWCHLGFHLSIYKVQRALQRLRGLRSAFVPRKPVSSEVVQRAVCSSSCAGSPRTDKEEEENYDLKATHVFLYFF